MAEFPALPLWTDAYLSDTRHLSQSEHGAYLLLLFTAWRMPDCGLPDDDALLARFASCDRRTWQRQKPVIMALWYLENGRWFQKRLRMERELAAELSSKRAEAGRAGGHASATSKSLRRHARDKANVQQNASKTQASSTISNITEPNGSSGQEPPMDDLKLVIFGKGLDWLAKHTGREEKNLRPVIGKWCATHGDGKTLEAMREAQKDSPVDPVAYIEKILDKSKGLNGHKPIDWQEALRRAEQ
jgi:uncharacterized protein YdaU (DUF1376 family)